MAELDPPSQMWHGVLPRHMKGGIDNPLGARAMYLDRRSIASQIERAETIGQGGIVGLLPHDQ